MAGLLDLLEFGAFEMYGHDELFFGVWVGLHLSELSHEHAGLVADGHYEVFFVCACFQLEAAL